MPPIRARDGDRADIANKRSFRGAPPSIDADIPMVAVVGRPNVGKSSLVNRISGRSEAVTDSFPGVTRDRKTVTADWNGRLFQLVDTGGWTETQRRSKGALEAKVSEQAARAATSADLVLFVLDAVIGVTEEDQAAASMLRRKGTPVLLVANKVDSDRQEAFGWDAVRLGMGEVHMVSAIHGRGVGDMLDCLVAMLPEEVVPQEESVEEIASEDRVAIVGRPNVGKSTLFNRLVGEERSIVHDEPGTTRDSVDTVVSTEDGSVRFVDTAGLRRRAKEASGAEYYSLVRALSAIDQADVSLLVIDSTAGVTHQDQRLAERIDAAGSPVVIVLNKWEMLSTEMRKVLVEDVEDRLAFLSYAPLVKVSALSGLGVHKLLPAIAASMDAYHRRVPTSELNKVLKEAQVHHGAPGGAYIRYATQGAVDPPTFTLWANRPIPRTYVRYLERFIREKLDFGPTPLILRVRNQGRRR